MNYTGNSKDTKENAAKIESKKKSQNACNLSNFISKFYKED